MVVGKRRVQEREVAIVPAALVIGGGIAGMQAALDIANAGFAVYLVEKEPSLGGRMAQIDEVFPTLDCAACIQTPKMVEVGYHPNIELMTCGEVKGIQGQAGNFKVEIRKNPRYVDIEKCTGCGDCAGVCPVTLPNEFDMGLGQRKAIYIPFPQAVPLKYTIDKSACLDCQQCEEACDAKAINLEAQEEVLAVNVGAIIVATGYDPFDARLKPEYGYGIYPNVITGLELERLSIASGPTQGEIRINGKKPGNVVFLQCVGEIPEAKVTICYTDIRAFGKGHEQFYERVQREGVLYRRGSVSEVYKRGEKLVVRAEDTLLGEPFQEEADLVVLATGLVPRQDAHELMNMLNISPSADGFFLEAHPKLGAVESGIEGIFLAGCCQGPKDITDSVIQASGAAAMACIVLSKAEDKP
jgi:heterodisulfide reductase subunit A